MPAMRLTPLVAGAALVALGILLVLDTGGSLHLGFAYAVPAAAAALGIVLIANGLEVRARDSNGREDRASDANGPEERARD